MVTTIQKWGNSLGVRLPREITRTMHLEQGSRVLLDADDKRIIIKLSQTPEQCFHKNDWKQFVIPIKRKKENVSGIIDKILYG